MQEIDFVNKIKQAGGRVFLVGGYVRDILRGVTPHDKDYVVTGLSNVKFSEIFPNAIVIGKSFPVYQLLIDGVRSEVAFARRERKVGIGYHGFSVETGEHIAIEEDLYRRDTTINAMAWELPDNKLIDPYGGQSTTKAGIIDCVSEHFADDPVRALRAARQAAQFGFTITADTIDCMRRLGEELRAEPTERIMGELTKALSTQSPSIFFRMLDKADLLQVTFPELWALKGKTQPEFYHPEGDAYEHSLLVLDTVAGETDDIITRFAALVHDIGKGVTPLEMLPHHYGHEVGGIDIIQAWNRRMTLPKTWLKAAKFVISEHMRAARLNKVGKIADLLLRVKSSGLSMANFKAIIRADNKGLPDYLEQGETYLAVMENIKGDDYPTGLQGSAIGNWLRHKRIKALRDVLKASNN